MSNNKDYTRREFIDRSTKGAASLLGLSLFKNNFSKTGKKSNMKSMVVVVKDDNASDIIKEGSKKYYNVNQEVVQVMMNTGIRQLTGIEDTGEAWKSLFPGITKEKIISIKINCIARQSNSTGLATSPEVAYSIANGLTQMQVDGSPFPEENIIIWDRSIWELERSGFSINSGSEGVRCLGTRQYIDWGKTGGYSTLKGYNVNGSTQYLSNILVNKTNYLINLCLLKNHTVSGVTFSLKNHYGCIHNVNIDNMHRNGCNPAIPILNTLPPIRDKQVLCISEAVYGIISGGPMGSPQVTPNRLIFSKDLVALDTICSQILRDYGTSNSSISKARYIATAASASYNLGTNDPANIDLVTIENPTSGIIKGKNAEFHPGDFRLFQNYPNPFNVQTTLSYSLFRPSKVKIDIFNIKGSLVRRLIDKHQSTGYYRIVWNGLDCDNFVVPSGNYLARFKINGVSHAIKIQLIK